MHNGSEGGRRQGGIPMTVEILVFFFNGAGPRNRSKHATSNRHALPKDKRGLPRGPPVRGLVSVAPLRRFQLRGGVDRAFQRLGRPQSFVKDHGPQPTSRG